ncbi:methylenetetrahydrofolate reductase [NAD(P)H] [Geovibrio thiophilus]|uniref:Methylenetetrahydrofolate reductase n=1 Tax=Geovibrio thiophilus TaxID=139438 RepID=A0A3R5Y7I8_9BACT|nr:methylenetetrahydrofolate reductase [NAD(P)H] [Geovibrio thiophilus]QAR33625.1 methylenetetrahydrofolate reductase [NAD(P)H] [Geovibrio thiophilus]
MKIIDIINSKRTISFEFFPPKKEEAESVLFDTISQLKKYSPDFVSVTYGAGGSTTEKTVEWIRRTRVDYGLEVMMHLTCVAATCEVIKSVTSELDSIGVKNILALRGDVPLEMNTDEISKEFEYASDLVNFLKKSGDYSVGVACYPEGHVQTKNIDKELEHLKLKQELGADFAITQLFFVNDYFYRFIEKCEKAGITIPIIAGVMPITNISQVIRFTQMCGVEVPVSIISAMEGRSEEDMFSLGVDYAVEQCADLWKNGVRGVHFYTLNRSGATEEVLKRLF